MTYKSTIALCTMLLLLCSCGAGKSSSEVLTDLQEPDYRQNSDVLIIYYDAEIGRQPLLECIKKQKAEIIYEYSLFNAVAVKLHKHVGNSAKAVATFAKVKGVISVQRDRIVSLDGQ